MTVAVCNAIIVQLSRIMSVLLRKWSVSTRVMCGDDYAIISWREVMVERSEVRRQEINSDIMHINDIGFIYAISKHIMFSTGIMI